MSKKADDCGGPLPDGRHRLPHGGSVTVSDRWPVRLHGLESLTTTEVAMIVGCSPSTVRRHAQQAGVRPSPEDGYYRVSLAVLNGWRYRYQHSGPRAGRPFTAGEREQLGGDLVALAPELGRTVNALGIARGRHR